jgi:hypothetical protein
MIIRIIVSVNERMLKNISNTLTSKAQEQWDEGAYEKGLENKKEV